MNKWTFTISLGYKLWCQTLPVDFLLITRKRLWASPVAQWVKNLPTMLETQETRVQSLAHEDFLQEGIATNSSILAWRIPWTEEPGRLQSKGSQRVGATDRVRKRLLLNSNFTNILFIETFKVLYPPIHGYIFFWWQNTNCKAGLKEFLITCFLMP